MESVLQDYRVRDAKLPRNFKFTFKKTGFYHTLKRRVAEKIKSLDYKRAELMSKVEPISFYQKTELESNDFHFINRFSLTSYWL